MGVIMKEDDIYIASLFDLLNLRFGPSEGVDEQSGGIAEMTVLQREFQIIQRGRSFRDTAAILNLGGFWNARSKNRWFSLLEDLKRSRSNRDDASGDQAIVNALITNLEAPTPLPVHFTSHDLRKDTRVLIEDSQLAVPYIDQRYVSISIPMKPK